MLYVKVDAQCNKLTTVVGRMKLTVLATAAARRVTGVKIVYCGFDVGLVAFLVL